MGYNIYIGNAKPVITEDDFDWEVEPATHPDAPTFEGDEMTGKSNKRFPSYTAWANSLRAADLEDLFLEKYEGLMSPHPGIKPLKQEHLAEVENKVAAFQKKHPHAVPRFGEFAHDNDAALARLLWLQWWMRWALENCQHPAIYNS